MIFKLTHPEDLISRLFILDYMREIGPKALYEKANETQKKLFFYKFLAEENQIEEVDINWEFCLFAATMQQLEFFMQSFLEEIKEIDSKFTEDNRKRSEQAIRDQIAAPASISIYDMANSEMKKNSSNNITL